MAGLEMFANTGQPFLHRQIAVELKHRALTRGQPRSVFAQAAAFGRPGVVLRGPQQECRIGVTEACGFALAQALDADGRVQIQEDDQVEEILDRIAPADDGPGQGRR